MAVETPVARKKKRKVSVRGSAPDAVEVRKTAPSARKGKRKQLQSPVHVRQPQEAHSPGRGGRGGRGARTGRGGWSGRGKGSGKHAPEQEKRRPLADILDYVRNCAKTLDAGLAGKDEEELLASRAIEEIGDRMILVAADQRGSRPLEKLLRRASGDAFAEGFGRLIEALTDLAPNQYASHVLESAFASWAERFAVADPSQRPSVAHLATACQSLSEDGGWSALIDDACASHTIRALLLALGGYVPEAHGKGKTKARAGLLPERKVETPPEVVQCRQSVVRAFSEILRVDEALCLSANGSPVVQLLLRILRDRGERTLLAEIVTSVIGAKQDAGTPSNERCDMLLHSAPGSRVFEAVLETCSADVANGLFSVFFRPRLRTMLTGKTGEFGAFLLQKLADSLREEPQLQLACGDVDFNLCLGSGATAPQQTVIAKMLEACLRLRACFKVGTGAVFRALGIQVSAEYHRVWPTLLALEHVDSPEDLLRVGNAAGNAQLRRLPAAGPLILGLLLRFPADAVQPLNSGLPKLLEHPNVLIALACESRTAKVLEAALAPSSALLPKLRGKLARAFKGHLGVLGPHSVGGWVCAALWRASLGEPSLREAFAQELLAVEEELRAHNFAVWKVCGLHRAKTKQEEWAQQQQKASKTKRLFDGILEGADPEAAKAVAHARALAKEDAANKATAADPFLVGLMPDEGTAEADVKDVTAEGGEDGEADEEMDRLFSTKSRRKGAKRKQEPVADADIDTQVLSTGAGSTNPGDADLREALELIAGKAPRRNKKKRRKAAGSTSKDAMLGNPQADCDDDDDDASH